MRTLALIILESVLLFTSTACIFDDARRASSALGEAPPATPKMIDFATDFYNSWNPGGRNGMWRTVIEEPQPPGRHVITEAQCPDRYRIVTTGAERSEKIYIGKTMYERDGDGPWMVRPMQIEHMMLNQCGKGEAPKNDPARIRLLAEQFSEEQIGGPEIREINGHACREWTRSVENAGSHLTLTTCYDTKTSYLLRIKYGEQVTTYDYDSRVNIKPPL